MNKAFIPLIIVAVLLVPFGALVIFSLESSNENSEIKTLLDAFWWSTVTITTVGYGDLVPVTDSGRIFAIFYIFSGILIAGVFISLFTVKFYNKIIEHSTKHEFTEAEKIMKKMEGFEKQQKQNTETLEKLLKKLEEKN